MTLLLLLWVNFPRRTDKEKMNMNLLQKFREEPMYNEIMIWAERFKWADKIKSKAGHQNWLYRDSDVMDIRMERIWNWVRAVEPVPTFENGTLSGAARGLLNMATISKAFK
jgi:hypothetical protein